MENLEKFYNFKRSGDLQKGDVSQDYYTEWMETKEQKLLDEIKKNNIKIYTISDLNELNDTLSILF